MIEFFESAGLLEVTGRSIDVEVSYPTFDDYLMSQTGLANPVVHAMRNMAAGDVERVKSSLREKLAVDASGRIAYPARANAVRGRKPQ